MKFILGIVFGTIILLAAGHAWAYSENPCRLVTVCDANGNCRQVWECFGR